MRECMGWLQGKGLGVSMGIKGALRVYSPG